MRLLGAPEASEVDDPTDAGLRSGSGEGPRHQSVALAEGAAFGHRMHEVVGNVDALEHRREQHIGEVATHDLDAGPVTSGEAVGITHDATYLMTPGEQARPAVRRCSPSHR